MSEWQTVEHALRYLERADRLPHRTNGEAALLEMLPAGTRRVLDLGSGDGRLIQLVLCARPNMRGVALDFSAPMLQRLRERFHEVQAVEVVNHDFSEALPDLGKFDAVVSSFAIHHLEHPRKRELYQEVLNLLEPEGVFCNLEHVASATPELHLEFLSAIGYTPETEDPSNKLLDVETQLHWLREIGFKNVDCLWKWRELALLVGTKGVDVTSQERSS